MGNRKRRIGRKGQTRGVVFKRNVGDGQGGNKIARRGPKRWVCECGALYATETNACRHARVEHEYSRQEARAAVRKLGRVVRVGDEHLKGKGGGRGRAVISHSPLGGYREDVRDGQGACGDSGGGGGGGLWVVEVIVDGTEVGAVLEFMVRRAGRMAVRKVEGDRDV